MKKIVGSLIASTAVLSGVVAEEAKSNTFADSFKNAKIKGTIGTYLEAIDSDADGKDGSWQTVYLKLKAETQRWNNLKLGAEFISHGQVFEGDDDNDETPYDDDIETSSALAQVYLDYAFTDSLTLRAGRWSHGDFTHIDDAQAQGIYLRSQGEKFSWVIGAFNEFAELDYDDMEDWTKDSQDLADEGTYGEDSDDFAVFAEAEWSPADIISINPYVYHQGDYASVFGMDNTLTIKLNDGLKIGAKVNGYHVSSDVDDADDSFNYAVEPFVKVGGVTASVGFASFDGDGVGEGDEPDSLNKPKWFRDYLTGFDQDKVYGFSNCDVSFAKLAYKNGNFGTHLYYGFYEYGVDQDNEVEELEFQVKYKFAGGWDANIRLFDVDYNTGDKDYQKVEARVRFKF